MIVYGDRVERVRTADRLAAIAADLAAVAALPPGLDRHAALVAAFIALGQVVQGVADADLARTGADGGSAGEAALMPVLHDLAGALLLSWNNTVRVERSPSRGENEVETCDLTHGVPTAASRLRSMLLDTNGRDTEIDLRLPEGYAFYAVYPEAYVEAARRLVLAGPPRVIGIRSIGTGLAALVAAVLGAPPPLTVRPTGHPFDRRIALAAAIDPAAHYVVVDEGPGLSGSSLAAVADHLEAVGVPPERIAFLPSHAGEPGAQASAAVRARWAAAQRPAVGVDELVPPKRLAAWVEPLIGQAETPVQDISGGAWRGEVFAGEEDWPAVNPSAERRKFLLRAGGERWLLKFAGLGKEGERKLARARLLAAAGLVPEVRGLAHGFLVQRWVEATPLAAPPPLDVAARYLAARTRLPAAGAGASLAELAAMAQHNIGLALGPDAAAAFARRHGDGAALENRVVRVAIDGRCDLHEWLRTPDGRILKADALDHDAGHDLVGAQDLAWDVAGCAVEFGLADPDELAGRVEAAAGRVVDRALLAFLTPCYLAFRLGAAQLAADSLGGWPAEQARNLAAVARYRSRLGARFRPTPGTVRAELVRAPSFSVDEGRK